MNEQTTSRELPETQHGHVITDDWKFWPPCGTCGGMCPRDVVNCPDCQLWLNSKHNSIEMEERDGEIF